MSDALALRFQNTALIAELLAAQDKLKRSHEELELRVAERTLELSRSNAELERLAHVASHDLQEPLRNAANFALLLESRYRDRLDTDGREFLGYIVSGVKHMRELVDGLLFHSRMGVPPRLQPTDCEALLEKVLEEVGGGKVRTVDDPTFAGSNGSLAIALDASDVEWEQLPA